MADQGHVHTGRRRHGPQRGTRVPALGEKRDGGFEDRDSLVNALETRETSAGAYVSPVGIEFFTASAGNAQIAQVASQLAAGMQAGISAQLNEATAAATEAAVLQGATGEDILALQQQAAAQANAATVSVTDVVGGGNAMAGNVTMMPLLIGGMMGGALTSLLVKRPGLRFVTLPLLAAGVSLMKSLSFFPEASTAGEWITLALWAAGGIVLLAFGELIHRDRNGKTAPEPTDPAVA